jgi:hypothetical protein
MLSLFRICGILLGFSLMILALLWGQDFDANSGLLMAGGALIVMGSLIKIISVDKVRN